MKVPASALSAEDDAGEEKKNSAPDLLRNIRGIIFDFDGTLFDNALIPFYLIAAFPPDIFRVWKERLVRKSFADRDYGSAEEYYGAFFAALGKACRCSPGRIQKWYFYRYMPRMINVLKKHYKPRPGVKEFLESLDVKAPGHNENPRFPFLPRIAVYSDYPFLKERMEALGVKAGEQLRLYGPESFGAQKPAPGPFRRIAEELGAAPEEILVVGDREETDGLGAFNAGMRFFCVETGRRRYFRLDPYRRPMKNPEPHGPELLMYAGAWNGLVKLLYAGFSRGESGQVRSEAG